MIYPLTRAFIRHLHPQYHQHIWNKSARKHKRFILRNWHLLRKIRLSLKDYLSKTKRLWRARCQAICSKCWVPWQVASHLDKGRRPPKILRPVQVGKKWTRHNTYILIYLHPLLDTNYHFHSILAIKREIEDTLLGSDLPHGFTNVDHIRSESPFSS